MVGRRLEKHVPKALLYGRRTHCPFRAGLVRIRLGPRYEWGPRRFHGETINYLEASGLGVGLDAGFASEVLAPSDPPDVNLEAGAASPAIFFFLSFDPLKSVSYQPPPLSLNPAADINLLRARSPQDGHCFKGSSDSR